MTNRICTKVHYRLVLLGLFLAPTAALASMPPVELLLIVPLGFMLATTVAGWQAARLLRDPTARHFTRLLLLALLWTPVPLALQNFLPGFVLSGPYLWSFLLERNTHSPYDMAEIGREHLAVAIAVGLVCVLGGILVVARSVVRLRQLRHRQRFGETSTT